MSKQPVVKIDRSSFGLDRLSGMITFAILINQFKEQQGQQKSATQPFLVSSRNAHPHYLVRRSVA